MHRPTSIMLLASLVLGVGGACAEEGLRAGANAPDFSLPTVKKQVVTLKDAVAKGTVILHFWKSK
jgi:hypothetical protein